jgi:GH18 family chitinase
MVRLQLSTAAGNFQFIPLSDFLKLRDFRKQNPELKIMISMKNYFRQTSTGLRTEFANHLKDFLVLYEIDGADIGWEFPAAADRENFVLLLREVKRVLQPVNKFLSIAVDPCLLTANHGYDVPAIMEEIDFATLMLYDMHGGGWQNYTANHGKFRHATARFNVNEKLVVGIPTLQQKLPARQP